MTWDTLDLVAEVPSAVHEAPFTLLFDGFILLLGACKY